LQLSAPSFLDIPLPEGEGVEIWSFHPAISGQPMALFRRSRVTVGCGLRGRAETPELGSARAEGSQLPLNGSQPYVALFRFN